MPNASTHSFPYENKKSFVLLHIIRYVFLVLILLTLMDLCIKDR